MNSVWKFAFFMAIVLWAVTLAFVFTQHHEVLDAGAEWSNAHLFARAPPVAAQEMRLADIVAHRPVFDAHLLYDTADTGTGTGT